MEKLGFNGLLKKYIIFDYVYTINYSAAWMAKYLYFFVFP